MNNKYISRDNLELVIDGLKFGITPDWNENDKNEFGYIENRPFYTESGIIVDKYSSGRPIPKCNFIPGNKYNVIWNGISYNGLICYKQDEFNCIGGEGYPFYIDDDGGDSIYVEPESGFTVSVIGDIVHQLDEKYIPDSIARMDSVNAYNNNILEIIEDNKANMLVLDNNGSVALAPTSYESVVYGNGIFVGVSQGGNKTAYSVDGINWTETTLSIDGLRSNCYIIYGDGKFFIISRYPQEYSMTETVTAYSTNGVTWTKMILPKWLTNIAYGNGRFVAIGNRNITAYSTDGITWTTTEHSALYGATNIAYGGGKFISVGAVDDVGLYSTDGITWEKIVLPEADSGYSWTGTTYGDGKFIIYSGRSIAYSVNGIDWTKVRTPIPQMISKLVYGNGKFIIIGGSNAAYSTDCVTWERIQFPGTMTAGSCCVFYGNNKFIAIPSNRQIIYSVDGITWSYVNERISQGDNDVTGNIQNLILRNLNNYIYPIISIHNTDETSHSDIRNAIANKIPIPPTAKVGQTIVVKSIDENGKPTEWEVVDTQSDWNQNDTAAADYIKNRPFYTSDPQEVIVAQETTPEEDAIRLTKMLVEGQEYKVTFNGTEYLCIARKDGIAYLLGNGAVYPYGDDKTDTGEPFAIEVYDPNAGPLSTESEQIIVGYVYVAEGTDITTVTVSITTMDIVVYTLDPKYIPDLGLPETFDGAYVGKITDQEGEIFNDYLSNKATSWGAHAEGQSTTANGSGAHAEGYGTTVNGNGAHAEGYLTNATTSGAHAEGYYDYRISDENGNTIYNLASGLGSHAEGGSTIASGQFSHAEGRGTKASGWGSHAEGNYTTASGDYSHAEGNNTTTSGSYSHAEGLETTASGDYSHTEGRGTRTQRRSQHVQGEYNILDLTGSSASTRGKYAHIVGNGTSSTAYSNAHTLDWNGVGWFQGGLQVGGNAQDDGAKNVMLEGNAYDYFILNDVSTGTPYKIQIIDGNLVSSAMTIETESTT